MIEVEDLSKQYSGHYAIKDISFKISQKETVAIVGPSGSGKSTLLRCINQLETPSSGRIFIDGKKLLPSSGSSIRGKIGMVFQHFNLFPHMNVLQNLTYAPVVVRGTKPQVAKEKALEFLHRFNLDNKSQFMPHNLSGGQKQRVAIARSLMMQPDIILFDEPTSALDPEVVGDVAEVIDSLKHEMISIVVTHHIRFAKAIADRIIFMDQGRVLCDQPREEFFTKPKSHRARLFLEKVGEF